MQPQPIDLQKGIIMLSDMLKQKDTVIGFIQTQDLEEFDIIQTLAYAEIPYQQHNINQINSEILDYFEYLKPNLQYPLFFYNKNIILGYEKLKQFAKTKQIKPVIL